MVGFDDSSAALACEPPLTTVRQPVEDMAAEMARLLLRQINDPGHPAYQSHLRADARPPPVRLNSRLATGLSPAAAPTLLEVLDRVRRTLPRTRAGLVPPRRPDRSDLAAGLRQLSCASARSSSVGASSWVRVWRQ